MNEQSVHCDRFLTRIRDIHQQLEVVDAALDAVNFILDSCASKKMKTFEALKVSKKQYKTLNVPVDSFSNVSNRTKKNNHEYALHVMYTYFGEYFRNILKDIYRTNPLLVVNKAPGSLAYHEIAKLGSYDTIADFMVNQVFKKLEGEKSTRKLLDKVLANTGVSVPDDVFDNALMYLEIRHLLVHQMGHCDQSFYEKYHEIFPGNLHIGGKFPISIGFVRKGLNEVTKFLTEIDAQLVSKGMLIASSKKRAQNDGEPTAPASDS